jgi:hypothetical protein
MRRSGGSSAALCAVSGASSLGVWRAYALVEA